MTKRLTGAAIVLLAVAGSGCSLLEPYVYKKDEFDRLSPTFYKEPDDRDSVTICYSPLTSDSPRRYALAEPVCARYGKVAVYEGRGAGSCPVLVPVEVIYKCVTP